MSHFYGTLQGSRGEATRCGTKSSGISTYTASYAGCVFASVQLNSDGVDWARVSLEKWQGNGVYMPLYDGPVGGGGDLNTAHDNIQSQLLDRTWILVAGSQAIGIDLVRYMLRIMTGHQIGQVCAFLREKGVEV